MKATLPAAVGIVVSAGVSTKLVERFPVRAVSVPGLLMAAAGLVSRVAVLLHRRRAARPAAVPLDPAVALT